MRFLFLFFLIGQTLFAQQSYTVSGRCNDTVDKVYLYYPTESEYYVDSCNIVDNMFLFKGSVDYPKRAILEFKNKKDAHLDRDLSSINFYIENSPITIYANSDTIKISNSKTQELSDEFTKGLIPIQLKMDSIHEIYYNRSQEHNISEQFQDSIDLEIKKINELNAEAITKFVVNHPNDFFSLYLLQSLIDNLPDSSELFILYNNLSENIKESLLGLKVKSKLDDIKRTSIGAKAPDFELQDLNNKNFKLSDFYGKYVLLLFWSSDCSHCLDELPNIKKIYNLLDKESLVIIAIAQDNIERQKEWKSFVNDNNLEWLNAFDERVNAKKKLASLYNINKTPYDIILNPKGEIIAKNVYGDNLFNQLSFLLSKKLESY